MQQTSVILRGVMGMLVGGAVGYALFRLAFQQGFYALALPGALLGMGCGITSGTRSVFLAVLSVVAATALGVYVEWAFRPFVADASFSYFLSHLHKLSSFTLLMVALGSLMAGWFGIGRTRRIVRGASQ